jgi:hypothetical protein
MIKRLRRSGFSDPLRRGRVRRAGCALCGHAVRGGFFPPEKEGKKETARVESGWARTSLSEPRHRPSLVTLTRTHVPISAAMAKGKNVNPADAFRML